VIFALKLFFCEYASKGTAHAQLAAYRRYLERRLDRYEALRESEADLGSVYPGHVLEHGIARARATLAWIDTTVSALAQASPSKRRTRLRRASIDRTGHQRKERAR
jgi:hypothetical protein